MSLIALVSDKGSPGTTTLGLALATVWPRRVALVECDPAGGDLALRLTDPSGRPLLRPEPGLLSLAAAVRGEPASPAASVWDHGQGLPGSAAAGSVVLAGLSSPEQGAGLTGLWPALAGALADADGGDVLADLGRVHPGSPALAVAQAAEVLVGVARGTAEGMLRLRDRLRHLLAALPSPTGADRRALVVLVVEDRRADEAVRAMWTVLDRSGLPVATAGFVAVDPGSVNALQGGQRGARLDRSLLLRSVRAVVPHLSAIEVAEPSTAAAAREPGRRVVVARAR